MGVIDIASPFIQRWEGCRLEAYRDVAGYPTQGFGHLLTLDKHIPLENLEKFSNITHGLAEQWLEQDLKKTLVQVEAELDGHGPFTDYELAALVSLTFNIGAESFKHSTVRAMLVTCDPPARLLAADAFRLWDKITIDGHKVTSPGLAKRRDAERALFLGASS